MSASPRVRNATTAGATSAHKALSVAARTGFCARGVIYLIVAAFITAAALGSGQRAHGIAGALQAIADAPAGKAVMLLLAAGLACLAGFLAVAGMRRRVAASFAKRWLIRLGMVGDAVVYAAFMVMALGLVLGWRSGDDATTQGLAARLFAHLAGRALVGIVGLGVATGGLGFIIWAWTGDIERRLDLPPRQKHLTAPISRFGLSGRGAAIALVGGYLLAAAIDADPSKAHGFGGVLNDLRRTAYGEPLLILFALAFGASGFFDFLEVLYRRVDLDQP